jgi:hypothetical protein
LRPYLARLGRDLHMNEHPETRLPIKDAKSVPLPSPDRDDIIPLAFEQ